MKPTALLTACTLLSLCIVAAAEPVHAICVSPRLFTLGDSYIVTPGCEAADCGSNASSITDNATGNFWAIGDGDRDLGSGIDNGAFPARQGWFFEDPGFPAWISSNWAASTAIDGCIDQATDPRRCMAILVTDERPDSEDGVFALMTRAPDSIGNYDFDAGGDVTLSTLGRLNVTGVTLIDEFIIGIAIDGINASELDAALYLDPACEGSGGGGLTELVQGYEVFATVLPITAAPPADGSSVDFWEQVTGVIPLGTGMQFQIDCRDGESLWLRAGLVFDSGYRTPFLSEQSTRLECTRTLADPEDPVQRKPRNRERPRDRSRGR